MFEPILMIFLAVLKCRNVETEPRTYFCCKGAPAGEGIRFFGKVAWQNIWGVGWLKNWRWDDIKCSRINKEKDQWCDLCTVAFFHIWFLFEWMKNQATKGSFTPLT